MSKQRDKEKENPYWHCWVYVKWFPSNYLYILSISRSRSKFGVAWSLYSFVLFKKKRIQDHKCRIRWKCKYLIRMRKEITPVTNFKKLTNVTNIPKPKRTIFLFYYLSDTSLWDFFYLLFGIHFLWYPFHKIMCSS